MLLEAVKIFKAFSIAANLTFVEILRNMKFQVLFVFFTKIEISSLLGTYWLLTYIGLIVFLHFEPENLKKSRPKQLVKSNKSISWNIFWPKSIFCNFKNGQKPIFELGKSLKLPKMQIHDFFFNLTEFTVGQKIKKSPGKKTC